MPPRVLHILVALTIAAGGVVPARAAEAATAVAADASVPHPPLIAAADAHDHVGEECVVEMVVRAARALADKDVCFLNSRKSQRDDTTFTAVIFKGGLARFRDAGIDNPALHFLDRKIRVRGVVGEYRDRPQIVVEDPAQIEVVDEPAESPAAD